MVVDILGWMNRSMYYTLDVFKVKGEDSIKLFSFVYSISNKFTLCKKNYCTVVIIEFYLLLLIIIKKIQKLVA